MTDYSVPRRMSLGALIVNFLRYLRMLVNATIIFMVYEIFRTDGGLAESVLKILAIIGGAAALALILSSIAFFQMKFHVENGSLIYRHGLISRATTTIPLNRIHTLRTRQGLLYRLFELRGVLFDTLAVKGDELELILSESDWQALLNRVETQELPQPVAADVPPVYNPVLSRKFGNRNLLLDALCQNHLKGMVVLGGFAAVIFNSLSDLPENTVELIAGYFESQLGHFAVSVAGIAVIMAVTYLLSLVLWLGKVLLRYYDLSLSYDSNTLTFTHGLLSKLSSRFARDKICTVRVKRNYFEKRFGLCTLALKQALNSSAHKEEDNLKIYGRDSSGFFLGWWLGREYASETEIASAKSGKGVIVHSLLPDVALSALAAFVLWHFGQYVWLTLPAIYLTAGIPKGILAMRHSSISLRDSCLTVSDGRFAEIKNYMKYDNVEVVRITRTPMSRFTGRVALSLSTSGSTFTVRSLKQDEASHIRELLLAKCGL